MKRRIFCAVMTVVLVLTMLPVVVGAEGGPEITFDPVVAEDGKTVSVTVGIANNPGLVTATIPVEWDENVLTLTDVEASTAVFATGFCGMTMEEYEANGTQGVYYLAWDNDTRTAEEGGDFTGNGALAVMTFEVAEGKSGTTAVNSKSDKSADIANLMDFAMYDHWGEVSYSEKEFELGTSGGEDEPDDPGVDADAPTIVVDSVSVSKSTEIKTVSVDVSIENNTGLGGMLFKIAYPEAFALTSVERGDALETLDYTKPGILTANPVSVAWDGIENDFSNGTLLTLTFTVPANTNIGEYPIQITYKDGDIYNIGEGVNEYFDINVNIVNGGITVSPYKVGDANGDNEINGKDVTLIRRRIVGTYNITDADINLDAADVNHDGELNGKDVTMIRRYLVGTYGVVLQ